MKHVLWSGFHLTGITLECALSTSSAVTTSSLWNPAHGLFLLSVTLLCLELGQVMRWAFPPRHEYFALEESFLDDLPDSEDREEESVSRNYALRRIRYGDCIA